MKNKEEYPANWEELSKYIRYKRAGNKCEGSYTYPHCRAENKKAHPVTGSNVVLTVAHLDHNTTNNNPNNLRALCQRCHLKHDERYHANNKRIKKLIAQIKQGQKTFPFYSPKQKPVPPYPTCVAFNWYWSRPQLRIIKR